MATKYYQNAHAYFVEAPLTYGGSISVAPGKYVEGLADTGATFPRLASLGILTDAGLTSVGDTGSAGYLIGLTPSLLIFSEPSVPLVGATGDTGVRGTAVAKGDTGTASTVAGNTGVTGTAGNTGVAGTHGDTGTAGAKGDTGAAGT